MLLQLRRGFKSIKKKREETLVSIQNQIFFRKGKKGEKKGVKSFNSNDQTQQLFPTNQPTKGSRRRDMRCSARRPFVNDLPSLKR